MAGNALRHTFKTLHVGLGISETLSHFLMGHALEGVSAKYIAELIVEYQMKALVCPRAVLARVVPATSWNSKGPLP